MSATLQLLKGPVDKPRIIRGLPEWNAANDRASQILRLLGFGTTKLFETEVPLDEFLHAIELYQSSELGTLVDTGTAARTQTIPGQARITDCAIREGYFEQRIQQLKDICIQGKKLGAETVCFN